LFQCQATGFGVFCVKPHTFTGPSVMEGFASPKARNVNFCSTLWPVEDSLRRNKCSRRDGGDLLWQLSDLPRGHAAAGGAFAASSVHIFAVMQAPRALQH
jgi:hypothetical protein